MLYTLIIYGLCSLLSYGLLFAHYHGDTGVTYLYKYKQDKQRAMKESRLGPWSLYKALVLTKGKAIKFK